MHINLVLNISFFFPQEVEFDNLLNNKMVALNPKVSWAILFVVLFLPFDYQCLKIATPQYLRDQVHPVQKSKSSVLAYMKMCHDFNPK